MDSAGSVDAYYEASMPTVHLLDYVAGNVRSLVNAINTVGYSIEWVKKPEDIEHAEVRKVDYKPLYPMIQD